MAVTYEPIASTTLGSDTASIEFTSIAGTWRDIVIVLHGYTSETSANDMKMQFNSDTGGNYSYTQVYGTGSAAVSNGSSGTTYIRSATNSTSSTDPLTATVLIMSYANTNVYKTTLLANALSGSNVVRAVGLWRSTNAITSVKFTTQTAKNFKAGFTASLYGIKAAA